MFWIDYWYVVLVLPAIILALVVQIKMSATYSKYSKVYSRSGVTAEEAARRILNANGLYDVTIERVSGNLTDHYDPRTNTVRLSDSVYGSNSLAAVGVAAHEVGHAIQHAEGYAPMKLRGALVPACVVTSKAAVPLLLIGILLEIFLSQNPASSILFFLGIACYALYALFTLITLPVEFNASRRAGENLVDYGVIDARDEKKVNAMLRAAGMTYVMSFAMALLQMLRIIAIFGGSRSRKK